VQHLQILRSITSQQVLNCCPLALTQAWSHSLQWSLYYLVDSGVFKISPDLHRLLLKLSEVTYWLLYWLLVLAVLHANTNLVG